MWDVRRGNRMTRRRRGNEEEEEEKDAEKIRITI